MGVSGLLGLLKSIHVATHVRDFAGKTIGVDAYGWLHRGAIGCAIDLAEGKPTTRYVDFAMHRVRMLSHFGVTPYIIFDGDRLPSKAATEEERAQRRRDSRKQGLELLRMRKTGPAYLELQKAIDITPEMAREFIDALQRANVKYIVAPYEADAQLVYLEQQGHIDAILSEDSDMLVFGAKTLLTKLDKYGECTMIRSQDFDFCLDVDLRGWSIADFRRMAIMSGCDYSKGLPRMGLRTAHRYVRKYNTIERTIQSLQLDGKTTVSPVYLKQYDQAEKTFLYQWVYCPEARRLVNLNPLDAALQIGELPYIGRYVEPATAQGIASGQLNPMTQLPIAVRTPLPSDIRRSLDSRGSRVESMHTGKKIDAFFKSDRVPLAELDPNSLTPISDRPGVMPSLSRLSSAPAQLARPLHVARPDIANAGPASHPSKKQRLCNTASSNDTIATSMGGKTVSKFFGTNQASPLATMAKRKNATARRTGIELWSDDSIEEAMLKLADPDDASKSPASFLQARAPRLSVFRDSASQKGLQTPASTADDEQIGPTKSLMLQRFALVQSQNGEACPRPSRSPARPRSQELLTPPATLTTIDHTNLDESCVVPNTPPQVKSSEAGVSKSAGGAEACETPATNSRRQRVVATDEVGSCTGSSSKRVHRKSLPPLPSPRRLRGSEDLLVVPDSEGEDAQEVGVGSDDDGGPRRALFVDDNDDADDNDAGDAGNVGDAAATGAKALDLARFFYAAG